MSRPPTRLRLITAAILIVGLGSAAWIYLTAESAPEDPLGLGDSKQYARAMELYGGKANVLAGELMHWFQGLWQGKRLALTVACMTVLVAALFRLVAAASQE